MILVQQKQDVPKEHHWIILKFSSVQIPGDERSRTHPGHGYPGYTAHHVIYEAYTNRAEWVAAIRILEEQRRQDYYAGEVKPAKVTVDTNVSIS
jgi:hypothetical protein